MFAWLFLLACMLGSSVLSGVGERGEWAEGEGDGLKLGEDS